MAGPDGHAIEEIPAFLVIALDVGFAEVLFDISGPAKHVEHVGAHLGFVLARLLAKVGQALTLLLQAGSQLRNFLVDFRHTDLGRVLP